MGVRSSSQQQSSQVRQPGNRESSSSTNRQPHGGRGTNQYAVKGASKQKQRAASTRKASAAPEAEATPAQKAEASKTKPMVVNADVQRYSEEHNEPVLARFVGGFSLKDNQPVDVVVFAKPPRGLSPGAVLNSNEFKFYAAKYGIKHAIEMKTVISPKIRKLSMKRSAQKKKAKFQREFKVPITTIAFDDRAVFNAKGQGIHDDTKRIMRFKSGFGEFTVNNMHEVRSSRDFKALLDTKRNQRPKAAR